jgi:hypothetical protein
MLDNPSSVTPPERERDRPLHESLLLLLLERGGCRGGVPLDAVLAGGVLVDLVNQRTVTITGGRVDPVDRAAARGGLLGAAAIDIASEGRRRSVRWWIDHLQRRIRPFRARVAERLVNTGVLAIEQHRALGLIPRTRVVVLDPGPGTAVLEDLRSILLGLRAPEPAQAELAGLVEALGLVGNLVGRERRRSAERLAQELLSGSAAAIAVARAFQAIRAEMASAAAAGATAAVVASST